MLVVIAWSVLVAAAQLGAPAAASTSSAALPAEAESERAAALEAREFGGQATTIAELLVADPQGIQPGDRELVQSLRSWLRDPAGPGHIAAVTTAIPSPDQRALLVTIVFSGDELAPTVQAIEAAVRALRPPVGTLVGVTGEPFVAHDLTTGSVGPSSGSPPDATRLLPVLVVLLVLAFVYRAALAVLAPLVTIGVALAVSIPLIGLAAGPLHLSSNAFTLPFALAVTLGAGTNYGVFLLSRYREERRAGTADVAALERAIVRVGHAVASIAAIVIVSTALMAVTTLDIFRTLGPAVAIAVATMLLASVTLLPALIVLSGRAFFWPSRQSRGSGGAERWWDRIGALAVEHPLGVVGVAGVVLTPLAFAAFVAQPSFDAIRALPDDAPSLRGYELLSEHFGQLGARSNLYLVAPDGRPFGPDLVDAVRAEIASADGVTGVSAPALSPRGTARFEMQFAIDPESQAASAALTGAEVRARDFVAPRRPGTLVLAGGQTAVTRDLQGYLGRDFVVVALVVALAIYTILGLLLRSPVAPLYLLLSVALSTAAAIGAVDLFYVHLLGRPFFWPAPVFAFVFLIALGEDFNVLLLTRIAEEAARAPNRRSAIANAVGATGGTISSAGLVMAAAFLLIARSPVWLVQQIGVVVVFGLLLDTFAIRPLLVPAIAVLVERRGQGRRRSDQIRALADVRRLWESGESIARISEVEDKPGGMREFTLLDPTNNLFRFGHPSER